MRPPRFLAFAYWRLLWTGEWRALLILGAGQVAALVAVLFLAFLVTGRRPPPANPTVKLYIVIVAIAVAVADQVLLVAQDRWAVYLPDFEKFSKLGRVLGSIATFGAIIGLFVLALYLAVLAHGLPST